MADLCGPSNPLRDFQKQSSIDRTLQQDRLSPRSTARESFRSPPGPNAAFLDAEFEAFQASKPFNLAHEEPSFFTPPPLQHFQSQADQTVDWVSDFRQFHLNDDNVVPLPSSSFRHHAPPSGRSTSPWHQDFLSQQRHERLSTDEPSTTNHRASGTQLQHPSQNVSPHGYAFHADPLAKGPLAGASAWEDDELFSKAFESVEANAQSWQESSTELSTITEKCHSADDGLHPSHKSPYRIGSDRIMDESEQGNRDESDELAKTAGILLENVKGDSSKKFSESNFLSLMRQLRDREVKIENERFVDVIQPLHPGGHNYPQSPPSAPQEGSAV